MLKLSYRETAQISNKELNEYAELVLPYLTSLREIAEENTYDVPEASMNLPFDSALHAEVMSLAEGYQNDALKYIVVLGIGGSNLGTKAVYDALYGYFDTLTPDRYPKMIFWDTSDAEFAERMESFVQSEINHPDEVLFVVISKSGGTTETIFNADLLFTFIPFKEYKSRVVVITDRGSNLWDEAAEHELAALPIPAPVGGRFSVFTPVGLFPLAAVGLDIQSAMVAAQEIRDLCLTDSSDKNPALGSATTLYAGYQNGYTIHDTFVFHPELESLGKWYRQLFGESLGKENVDGEKIGMTPTVSVGSTDLHSVGQLYLGGVRDKITTFVSGHHSEDHEQKVPADPLFDELVNGIEEKSPEAVMSAILYGVQKAYDDAELPFMTIDLGGVSFASIAAFMQYKMIEVMLLGKLFNVDAFDQPNVESYKIETKKQLIQ